MTNAFTAFEPLDHFGSQTLVSRRLRDRNRGMEDKVSGNHRIRASFEFNPTVDVPAAIYLCQLWLYSLSVLRPVQAARRIGMFPKTSLGKYPARRASHGEGKFYSHEFPDPVYLEQDSPQLESVREFDRGAQLYVGLANILRATIRVTFWGAFALALTAGIGKLFGTVV